MKYVVLLGDSIFDNAAYVAGGPDVVKQVQEQLPVGWRAVLRAVDGSVTRDVARQLESLPEGTGCLIVSVGGNDALNYGEILSQRAQSTAEVLSKLGDIGDQFQRHYREMLRTVLNRGWPTAICTIYYPRFPDPVLQKLAVTALTIFNDGIIREAFAAGLPLIDLRLVCNEEADYANPIEPSVQGGEKIAKAIVHLVTAHDFKQRRTAAFVS